MSISYKITISSITLFTYTQDYNSTKLYPWTPSHPPPLLVILGRLTSLTRLSKSERDLHSNRAQTLKR